MKNYLASLNSAQKEAVTTDDKHVLVLAGAGSGKTRVLVGRILWLLEEKKIPPHAVLALTFTNKAAKEMRERVQSVDKRANSVTLTTFHSYGARFLREYAEYCGLSRYFSIYDDDEAVALLKRLYPREPLGALKFFYHQIQRCKDGSLKIQEEQNLLAVYAAYNSALRQNHAVDFGDLIYLPQYFLEKNPLLRETVQRSLKAVLVDEYQDTNLSQAKMLAHMICDETYVTVVGDDDQSIYGFRGAEPSNMMDFFKKHPNCRLVKLEENYRSTPAVLTCANRVISHNSGRLDKELFSRKETGEKPQVSIFENQDDEAEYICRLLQDGNLHDTAVLYRVNAQSRSIETALAKAKIPYSILGSVRFYQREEVKSVLAWLFFLINPFDEAAFTRLITRPQRGIGEKTLSVILESRAENENILQALQKALPSLKGRAAKSCADLLQLFPQWAEKLNQVSLVDFFRDFIRESGIFEHYSAQDAREHTERLSNVLELAGALQMYGTGAQGLADFLESVMLDLQAEETKKEDGQERVILMTVHNAKGLEFRRVILTGMEEDIFPWESGGMQDIEEERRLCYVAVTRAKEQLYMTAVRWRSLYGKKEFRNRSRFIDEMGRENLNIAGEEDQVFFNGYGKGIWVRHEDYGIGYITNSKIVSGRHVVEVSFEGGRKAKFLPEFTLLEKLSAPEEY